MKNLRFQQVMVVGTLAIIISFSCNTTKKDFNNVNQAILRSPTQTAKQLNDWKPCIPLSTTTDSTAYKNYIKGLKNMADYYASIVADTVNTSDTLMEIWADTSKIKFYKRRWEEAQATIKKMNIYVADLTEKCNNQPHIRDTVSILDTRQIKILQDSFISETKNHQADNERHDKTNVLQNWMLLIILALGLVTGFTLGRKVPKLPLLP